MTEQQVLQKTTALCSAAEYCSHDILEKMRRWEVDDATQASVMQHLVSERYIDDERFCRMFVREKIRFNKWGRRKVEAALMQKRIPREIAQTVLDDVDDEEYLRILRPLLKSKAKTVSAGSDYEKNAKLIRFAMSRGFTFDIIRQCLDTDIDEI